MMYFFYQLKNHFQRPFKNSKNLGEKGQSIVEFLFLFSLIVLWAFLILQEGNSVLAKYWESLVKIIVNDPSQQIEIK